MLSTSIQSATDWFKQLPSYQKIIVSVSATAGTLVVHRIYVELWRKINYDNNYVSNISNYNYQKQMKKVEACVAAEKRLKEATAALRFEDVDTAIKKAEEAIAILTPSKY